jgi:hypothetical protein
MPSIRGLSRDDSDSHHLNSTFSGRWGCGKRPGNSARGGSRTRNDRSGKARKARLRSERWRRAQDSAKTPDGKAMARGRHLERRFGVSQRIAQVRIWKQRSSPRSPKWRSRITTWLEHFALCIRRFVVVERRTATLLGKHGRRRIGSGSTLSPSIKAILSLIQARLIEARKPFTDKQLALFETPQIVGEGTVSRI